MGSLLERPDAVSEVNQKKDDVENHYSMKVNNVTVDLPLTSCGMLAKGFNLHEP